MRLLILMFCCTALFAQTPTPGAATSPALPSTWVGVGATYGNAPSGSVSYAQLISKAAQVYSFTSHDFVRTSAKPYVQDVTSTGAALVLRTIGSCSSWCGMAFALGQVGAAVSSENTTAAYNTGAWVIIKLAKTQWTVGGGWKYISTGNGPAKAYGLDFGRILK